MKMISNPILQLAQSMKRELNDLTSVTLTEYLLVFNMLRDVQPYAKEEKEEPNQLTKKFQEMIERNKNVESLQTKGKNNKPKGDS